MEELESQYAFVDGVWPSASFTLLEAIFLEECGPGSLFRMFGLFQGLQS